MNTNCPDPHLIDGIIGLNHTSSRKTSGKLLKSKIIQICYVLFVWSVFGRFVGSTSRSHLSRTVTIPSRFETILEAKDSSSTTKGFNSSSKRFPGCPNFLSVGKKESVCIINIFKKTESPGPGWYDLEDKHNNPSFSKSGYTSGFVSKQQRDGPLLKRKWKVPDPGAYFREIPFTSHHMFSNFSTTFSGTKRFEPNLNKLPDTNIGPGNWNEIRPSPFFLLATRRPELRTQSDHKQNIKYNSLENRFCEMTTPPKRQKKVFPFNTCAERFCVCNDVIFI
ncbi:hypothetical protein RFI_21277 [Reticulomyxa filosa]|uniref:Uncharacterized protein n=1 Tax=Reticulomyxa filosa TaxID=46433 RepID=X6MRL1_RETFI|nr:hypothetical protein RFI_21277 [Reticulomyxa filosa]|eukprot:ETO16087.1 hypothetical protein RFI_21277 [Reticulomyxa filosa]